MFASIVLFMGGRIRLTFTVRFSFLNLILFATSSSQCFISLWVICMLTHKGCFAKPRKAGTALHRKPVLKNHVCSAAFKGIISSIDQLYHSPAKALQFAHVFSVYISVDGPLYLRKQKLYCSRCKGEQDIIREMEFATWEETRRV